MWISSCSSCYKYKSRVPLVNIVLLRSGLWLLNYRSWHLNRVLSFSVSLLLHSFPLLSCLQIYLLFSRCLFSSPEIKSSQGDSPAHILSKLPIEFPMANALIHHFPNLFLRFPHSELDPFLVLKLGWCYLDFPSLTPHHTFLSFRVLIWLCTLAPKPIQFSLDFFFSSITSKMKSCSLS